MWDKTDGKKIFIYGQDDNINACKAARECGNFKQDYEEECFADEEICCYNCRYRRWTADSFECMKK